MWDLVQTRCCQSLLSVCLCNQLSLLRVVLIHQAKKEACPLTCVEEGMFADPLKLMKSVNQTNFLLEKMDTYSLTEISSAISQSETAVIGQRSTTNVQLSVLLYFEPYAALSEDIEIIKALFVENEEQEARSDELVFDYEEVVTEQFLARVAMCVCTCHKYFTIPGISAELRQIGRAHV